MDKRLIFPQNVEDRRDAFFVREDRQYLRKHASNYHPEIQAYIQKAQPMENLVQVLLTALGAYEYWGQNVNGDRFRIPALTHEGTDYGYKTFETNSNYFLHHCFTKGTFVWTDIGPRPIQDIGVGDLVRTHTGRLLPVTTIFKNNYSGLLVTLRVAGYDRTLTSTKEHKHLVVRRQSLKCRNYGKGYSNFCTFYRDSSQTSCKLCKRPRKAITPEWVSAEDILPGDYLTQTPLKNIRTSSKEDIALGTVLGFYLAEGSLSKKKDGAVVTSVQFTFSELEVELIDKLRRAVSVLGMTLSKPYIHKQNHTATVCIHSTKFAARVKELCAEYSHLKKTPDDVYDLLGQEGLLALLGSYIDGDGHVYVSGKNKGQVRVRSCNETLLIGMRDISLNLGIATSYNMDVKASYRNRFGSVTRPNGVVSFSANEAKKLASYSLKCEKSDKTPKKSLQRSIFADGMWLHRVAETVKTDVTDEPVFNIEVTEDHTYQVEGFNTHNCNKDPALSKGKVLKSVWNEKAKRVELVVGIDVNLDPDGVAMVDRGEDLCFSMGCKVPYDVCSVCGNKAKTRAEYCDHLRYMINQIDPVSNQLVGADNTLPKFFDISRVLIPADKTAYMWTKVASASNPYRALGSAQLADLPPGKIADLSYLNKVAQDLSEARREKTAIAKKGTITKRVEFRATPEVPAQMEQGIPAAKTLLQHTGPTLSVEAIENILKTRASLDQILSSFVSLGMEPKPSEARLLILKLRPSAEQLSQIHLSPENVHSAVSQELLPLMEDRSFYRPILVKRIVKIANLLDENDPGMLKKAEEVKSILTGPPPKPEPVHPGYVAGFLAALYALFGPHSSGVGKFIGRAIADHPIIAIPIMAGAATGIHGLFFDHTPTRTGFYNVDANLQGLYNRPWQSRFAEMQARPVTVIKTGAAKADTELAKKVLYGVPAIFLGSGAYNFYHQQHPEKQPGHVTRLIADNPEVMSMGLVGEHLAGKPVSKRISDAVGSAKRLIKKASIRNLEFLEAAPENDRELIWDVAILDAAERIRKKLSGG